MGEPTAPSSIVPIGTFLDIRDVLPMYLIFSKPRRLTAPQPSRAPRRGLYYFVHFSSRASSRAVHGFSSSTRRKLRNSMMLVLKSWTTSPNNGPNSVVEFPPNVFVVPGICVHPN